MWQLTVTGDPKTSLSAAHEDAADQERRHGAQHMKTPGMAAAVMASARVSAHD